MTRLLRRTVVLLAILVVALVAATPVLAGMNDGGGFYSYSVPTACVVDSNSSLCR
ncbi:MAG TPA: hypothetical protein VFJ91_12375 [Gaiellaceae bacterium]|nr:hypothetical protein [Gaiellaceae bacterium]